MMANGKNYYSESELSKLVTRAFEMGMAAAKYKPCPEPSPTINRDEKAAAILKILQPKPELREECLEDIKAAFAIMEHDDMMDDGPYKEAKKALAQLLAALKKAQAAKTKLPRWQAHCFETVCDLAAGITFCENDQKQQTTKQIPRPPSHRQKLAVSTALALTQTWLPRSARALSRRSPWYKISAFLFGKKTNLLAHMSRHQKVRQYSRAIKAGSFDPGSK